MRKCGETIAAICLSCNFIIDCVCMMTDHALVQDFHSLVVLALPCLKAEEGRSFGLHVYGGEWAVALEALLWYGLDGGRTLSPQVADLALDLATRLRMEDEEIVRRFRSVRQV